MKMNKWNPLQKRFAPCESETESEVFTNKCYLRETE